MHQDACYCILSPEKQGFGKTKGGRNSKINAVTTGTGKLIDLRLIPGNESELKSVRDALGDVCDKVVLGDKGFDSDDIRQAIWDDGGVASIPGRKNRKMRVFSIKEAGKLRHVVENYFSRIKKHRRVGTRYDRLAETYLSFIFLASLMEWIRSHFVHPA